jgi:anti-anti-sigma factor
MVLQIVKVDSRRLNSKTGSELQTRVAAAFAEGASTVAVDLSEVAHADSLGIGALVGAQRRRPKERRLVLCAVNEDVLKVLELAKLASIFEFSPSTEGLDRPGASPAP